MVSQFSPSREFDITLTSVTDTSAEQTASQPTLSDEQAEAFLDAYSAAVVSVAERVSPAVVNIASEKDVTVEGRQGRRVQTVPSGGSGVVIAPDGYILTNSHVVHGARTLDVTMADGRIVSDEPSRASA